MSLGPQLDERKADAPQSKTPLGNWVRASVRFWAGALSLIDRDKRGGWPFFSYTDDEWRELDALAEESSGAEVGLSLVVNTVVFMLISALVVYFGVIVTLLGIYGNPEDVPAPMFFGLLGFACAAMASVGVPISMGLTALLVGVVFKSTSAVPDEVIRRLHRRIQGQCLRGGLAVTGLGFALAIPLALLSQDTAALLVSFLKILGPLTSVSVLFYLIGRRA